jgi:hypothetical protein
MAVALLLILNTSVLAGIMPLAGFLVLRTVPSRPSTTTWTICLKIRTSYLSAHFRFAKI